MNTEVTEVKVTETPEYKFIQKRYKKLSAEEQEAKAKTLVEKREDSAEQLKDLNAFKESQKPFLKKRRTLLGFFGIGMFGAGMATTAVIANSNK